MMKVWLTKHKVGKTVNCGFTKTGTTQKSIPAFFEKKVQYAYIN